MNELATIGIIVNEIITNSMKHAFTGRDEGLISVSASIKGNRMTLVIEDNGVSLPESVDIETSTGFGIVLIRMLTWSFCLSAVNVSTRIVRQRNLCLRTSAG